MRAKKVKFLRKVAKQTIENAGKYVSPEGEHYLFNQIKDSYKRWGMNGTKTEREKSIISGR